MKISLSIKFIVLFVSFFIIGEVVSYYFLREVTEKTTAPLYSISFLLFMHFLLICIFCFFIFIFTHPFMKSFQQLKTSMKNIQQKEEKLLYQSKHDPITTLPNRKYFVEFLSQKLEKAASTLPLAIVTIGVDRYPQINHALGHAIGERLLHHVGARLSKNLFPIDMLAHLTNNVFIALLPGVDSNNYLTIANQIIELFETPFSVYTVSIDVDVLIGFSFYPKDGVDAPLLIQKADLALYDARYLHTRHSVYTQEKDPKHFSKLSLMSELREGLMQNEFEIYYQPKIDLKSGKIVGVEALARWNHPIKGFMPPALFVPLAEETGHIKKLTFWLLEKGIVQCNLWHQANIPLTIANNLSVKDLFNKNLPYFIQDLINTYSIEPNWLTLEITESAFMRDPQSALAAIKHLLDMGIHFSVDDFGTGYSSLSYLKLINIHELKIDKSFTQDLFHSRVTKLVEAIIILGHSLGTKVVAEGVENLETYNALEDLQCDLGQGYLFSAPISSKNFIDWLRSSQWGLSF